MNFQVDTSNFEDQICSLFANTCMSDVQFSHWLTGKIDFFSENPVESGILEPGNQHALFKRILSSIL